MRTTAKSPALPDLPDPDGEGCYSGVQMTRYAVAYFDLAIAAPAAPPSAPASETALEAIERLSRQMDEGIKQLASGDLGDVDPELLIHAQAALYRLGRSAPAEPLSEAERDVLAERQRQIEVEGYTRQHDVDMHDSGDLAAAAACYALHTEPVGNVGDYLRFWPWDGDAWKPKDRYRNYIRAAALLIAAADVERTRGAAVLAKQGAAS